MPNSIKSLTFVKIMPNHTHKAVGRAVDASEGATEQFVSLAVAVDIGGHKCPNPRLISCLDALDETFFAERLTKVHKPSAAPRPVGCCCRIHNLAQTY